MPLVRFTPNVQRHVLDDQGELRPHMAIFVNSAPILDRVRMLDADDIAYRHALDVDAAGNLLAFGTTTGSLWVSEDQGDHWQTVSSHLPPIFCVRIGAV